MMETILRNLDIGNSAAAGNIASDSLRQAGIPGREIRSKLYFCNRS